MKSFSQFLAEGKRDSSMSTEEALRSVRKYSTLKMAKRVSSNREHYVPILLGDDGKFWLVSTNEAARVLMKAGYKKA